MKLALSGRTPLIALIALVGIVVLFGAGYFIGRHADQRDAPRAAVEQASHAHGSEQQHPMWVCPMHPHILQDHPGTCPICGMDLVEAESGDDNGASGLHVDTAMQQRMGVRLAALEYRTLGRELRTYGNVAVDETSIANVSPKVEGWVRKLYVSATGQRVQAGQPLYAIYSPDLVQRQREYIELLQRRDQLLQSFQELTGQNAQVVASLARERARTRVKFINADVSPAILDQIESTRRTVDVIDVLAPRAGYVTQIGARPDSYVTPMVNIFSMADTASAWIDIALYADQLGWVREGDQVEITLPDRRGQKITGRLTFATPTVDATSRTARARVVVGKGAADLRPGAFVDVTITSRPHHALVAPRSAVLRSGTGDRVMLARGDGHFLPVEVETGVESGEFIEIVDGLQEGAQVAVNGQFLLDAAASLDDAVQRMQEAQ